MTMIVEVGWPVAKLVELPSEYVRIERRIARRCSFTTRGLLMNVPMTIRDAMGRRATILIDKTHEDGRQFAEILSGDPAMFANSN